MFEMSFLLKHPIHPVLHPFASTTVAPSFSHTPSEFVHNHDSHGTRGKSFFDCVFQLQVSLDCEFNK